MTNKTIEIFQNTINWQGEATKVSLGNFDAYVEEHSTSVMIKYDGEGVDLTGTKGFFIIFDNLNLNDMHVKYDEMEYKIDKWDRYFDQYGDFHHIEATFK